ncbi:CU044_5270 family protein [Streptomyces sp. NPDC055287]
MNADKPHRTASARSETLESLSDPVEWDLPPCRHLHHKDTLMHQIDRDLAPSARTPRPSRRRLRPAVLVPMASMALAGALVVTLSGGADTSAPAGGAGATRVNSASLTLDRIAAASLKTDARPVKDGQFVYVRSLNRSNVGTFGGTVRLGAPYKREVWMSQDPTPVTNIGWARETGKGVPMSGQDLPVESAGPDGTDDTGAVPAGISRPTYTWLASLPTEPDALLELLYAETTVGEDVSKDEAVFGTIGELLRETIMPPANASALYKAAGKIPGVTEIPDAVDAAGRHGIGITREDDASATRDEWIFDKRSLAYLGSRSYMTKDKKRGGRADTLYGIEAIMQRAVVDQHGMEPAKTEN